MMESMTLIYSNKLFITEINEYLIQPLFGEIANIGEENYNKLLLPYALSLDMISNISDEQKKEIKVFDLIFCKNPADNSQYLFENKGGVDKGIPYLNILKDSLEFYFKKPIKIIEEINNQCIIIGSEGVLNRDNFDMLADIILKINYRDKPKIDKPKYQTDRQRDIHEKLMAGRQRKSAENYLSLADIANIVQHGGKSFISYEEINKLTISQLYNSYRTIMTTDSYDREYSQFLIGAKPDDLSINKHWSQQIKIKTD